MLESRLMKSRLVILRHLSNARLACMMACVFLLQGLFIAPTVQHMKHDRAGFAMASVEQAAFTAVCENDETDAAKNSGSTSFEAGCCLFCQVYSGDDNPSAVLALAKVVAVLAPLMNELVPRSWTEFRPLTPESIGLRSSWAAQAPPLA